MHAGAAVEHGHKEAFDAEGRIHAFLHQTYGLEEFTQAFQCEELGLHGDYHGVCRGEAVHRYEAERRRAVDENEIVVVPDGSQGGAKYGFPLGGIQHLYFHTHKVDVGGDHVQVGYLRLDECVFRGDFALHHLINRTFLVAVGREVQAAGCVCLRIGVDYQHLMVKHGQRGREIDGGGGLPHSSLLIRYRYYFSHNLQRYDIFPIIHPNSRPTAVPTSTSPRKCLPTNTRLRLTRAAHPNSSHARPR